MQYIDRFTKHIANARRLKRMFSKQEPTRQQETTKLKQMFSKLHCMLQAARTYKGIRNCSETLDPTDFS